MEATYYYYFDCLDGILGEQYLTAGELASLLIGSDKETITEKEIIRHARNYEATLYRYEKDSEGNYIKEVCLYDCIY